ncbi:hypothetical protein LXL04_012078 [Taraxacum kok-saghyz]
MTIAFDPSISSDYRLVYVCGLGNVNITGEGETNYQIEVFSSTTRTWKTSCQFSFDSRIDLDFKRGVYWNNAIHWLQIGGYILYFDLDEEIIHKKQTPLKLLGLDADSNRIFESRDRLLLVELELVSLNSKFKIHELKRDYSEWSVKYLVDIEEVGGLFPEIMNPRLATKFQFDIQSLVLGEKEGDCFLVLEIIGKALRYNLVTKTFHKLNDFPASRFPKYYRLFTGMPYVFPFVDLFPLFSLKVSADILHPKPDDAGDSFQCRRFLPAPTTPACSSGAASVPPSIPAPNLLIFLSPISISLSPIYQFPVADFILLLANCADFAVSGFYHSDFTQVVGRTTTNSKSGVYPKKLQTPFLLTMAAQSSSPTDKVLSIDDLLTGILFRLPVRSLLRFKSVSKRWYFLITSPSFKLLRSRNPDPPSGLFVPIRTNNPYLEYEFVSFDIENPVKAPFTIPNFDPTVAKIDIEHSCNGLMLCSSHSYDVSKEGKYVPPNQFYLYNPTINQFITLPGLENYDKLGPSGLTIAFDPSKSSHYRIIHVYVERYGVLTGETETNYQIEIFSSSTRTWKPSCRFPFDGRADLDFKDGVYWNNAVHWIQTGFILYFKLDEESFHEKETPLSGKSMFSNNIFESRDQLLIVELEGMSLNTKFKIHELKRDYSAWCLKYHVDIEEIGGSFPEIRHPRLPIKFEFLVKFIELGEKEEDSFLVLEVPGKALRFNLATNTFHKLHDFPESRYMKPNRLLIHLPPWHCYEVGKDIK